MANIYVGIKDEKIYDLCTNLANKRDTTIDDKDYLYLEMKDWFVGDTWNSQQLDSIPDSPIRNPTPIKNTIELKLEELEARIIALENK